MSMRHPVSFAARRTFGLFVCEQRDQEGRIGPGQHDLGPFRAAIDALDDGPYAVGWRVALSAGLLFARQLGFDTADFNDDVPVLEALDRPVHDFANALV